MYKSEARKILKSNGALLISDEAKDEFILVIKDISNDLATKAVELCKFRKGKIILKDDIRMATR